MPQLLGSLVEEGVGVPVGVRVAEAVSVGWEEGEVAKLERGEKVSVPLALGVKKVGRTEGVSGSVGLGVAEGEFEALGVAEGKGEREEEYVASTGVPLGKAGVVEDAVADRDASAEGIEEKESALLAQAVAVGGKRALALMEGEQVPVALGWAEGVGLLEALDMGQRKLLGVRLEVEEGLEDTEVVVLALKTEAEGEAEGEGVGVALLPPLAVPVGGAAGTLAVVQAPPEREGEAQAEGEAKGALWVAVPMEEPEALGEGGRAFGLGLNVRDAVEDELMEAEREAKEVREEEGQVEAERNGVELWLCVGGAVVGAGEGEGEGTRVADLVTAALGLPMPASWLGLPLVLRVDSGVPVCESVLVVEPEALALRHAETLAHVEALTVPHEVTLTVALRQNEADSVLLPAEEALLQTDCDSVMEEVPVGDPEVH